MNRLLYAAVPALIVALLGSGGYWWWRQQQKPPMTASSLPAAQETTPAAAPPASPPAVRFPIDESLAAASALPAAAALPALGEADDHVRATLTDLLGRQGVLSWLQTESFVRHAVATVDNLAREHASPMLWPLKPTAGRFSVDAAPSGAARISPDNAARYTAFVLFAEGVDTRTAAATYARLYPLFQQAYEDLGFPGCHFNDRLVEVIDHLLKTPEFERMPEVRMRDIKGPAKPARPWENYEFADPTLASLSSGQKLLLRMGPVNERRLKARLREFRRELVAGNPQG